MSAVRLPVPEARSHEFPFQYSGGMMQRALIVDALVVNPAFIIADNVTQPLDATLARRSSASCRNCASNSRRDRFCLPLAADGPGARRRHRRAQGWAISSGARRTSHRRRPDHDYSRDLLARAARIWSEGPPPLPPPSTAKSILSVQDVHDLSRPRPHSVFRPQPVQAVRGVSFDVMAGDNFGMVGESGCGKSTLSRLLSWIEQPDRGTIHFDGQDIRAMGRAAADHAPRLPAPAAGPLQLHPAKPDRRQDGSACSA